MAIDTTRVIVGAATLYTAPKDTAMPVDTLAEGADWPAPWVHVGGSEEGVSFAVGTDTGDIRIEEQATPVLVVVAAKNVRVLVTLSEDTVENMKLAYGGGTIVTTAAAAGQPGKKTLTLANSLDQLAVGFEGLNSFGFWRRVYIPSVLSVADVTTAYRRAANNRSYNVELRAVCDPSAIKIVEKTAAAI